MYFNTQKKILISFFGISCALLIAGILIQSCFFIRRSTSQDGGVVGVAGEDGWVSDAPPDMVLIPKKTFIMGSADEAILNQVTYNTQVTVSSFYIDETYQTNKKYREFVQLVERKVLSEEGPSLGTKKTKNEENEDMLDEEEEDEEDEMDDDEDDDEDDDLEPDEEDELEVDEEKVAISIKKIAGKIVFNRDLLEVVRPDEQGWRREFPHSMQDPMVEHYFSSSAFDDYPVVNISWEGAMLYTAYRQAKTKTTSKFSLPTGAQFEAAASKSLLRKYPWGGPGMRLKGKIMANFKSKKGDYVDSGYTYTSPVRAYPPNEYGVYDMAGNVWCWCLDSYSPTAARRVADIDPVYIDPSNNKKLIKGGSWKDAPIQLQIGTNDFKDKDAKTPYIGFRCVLSRLGAGKP